MNETHVLALDIGTSSVRAILFDATGEIVFAKGAVPLEAQVKYAQTTTADGGVEVDADRLVSVTLSCLSKALAVIRKAKLSFAGVGISCFWHSLLGVDGDGCAVTPVYSWADTRSAKYVAQLKSLFDNDTYHKITGAELHPCFWPAKLLWLRTQQPELFSRVKLWMGFAEYLRLRLFGSGNSSVSMASGTGLFNQQSVDWDQSILKTLDIDRSTLPTVDDSQPAQGIGPDHKTKLAGLEDVPWYSAVGDGACSNIGSGGTDNTRIVLNVGTSAAMRIVVAAPKGAPLEIEKGLFSYRVDQDHAIVGGAFANGGNVYAWLETVLGWQNEAEFTKEVAKVKPDGHGLTVLPFWAGERSPGWRADAKASILGMNLHTTKADIVRATLESLAYSFNDIRLSLHTKFPTAKELTTSGGALAHSPLLAQIIADVFGEKLITSKVAEASSRGAALIALQGLGVMKSWTEAKFERGTIVKPNAGRHRVYSEGVERYGRVYGEAKGL